MPTRLLKPLIAVSLPVVAVAAACSGGGHHSSSKTAGGTTSTVRTTVLAAPTAPPTTVTTIPIPTVAPGAHGSPASLAGVVAAIDPQAQYIALVVNNTSDNPTTVIVTCAGAAVSGSATSLAAITVGSIARITGTVSAVDGVSVYTATSIVVTPPPPPPRHTTTTKPSQNKPRTTTTRPRATTTTVAK